MKKIVSLLVVALVLLPAGGKKSTTKGKTGNDRFSDC